MLTVVIRTSFRPNTITVSMGNTNHLAEDMPYDEDELECAHALYSYVCCAFCRRRRREPRRIGRARPVASTPGVPVVPAMLARGFCECARRLGRRPMLDYCGCVLYNWELVDASGPISTENARMLRRFTGLVDEEWFFKTHLVIEAAAGPAVRAVASGRHACAGAVTRSSVARLTEALVRVEACFGHVVRDCLPLMFERLGTHGALCDYYFFYERLRPFISASTPPSCWTTSRSMPEAHRRFLRSVQSDRTARTFVLEARDGDTRTGDPADDASEGAKRELVARYNRCVDLVLDFRWRHLQMVKKYVLEPSGNHNAAGTGGTSAFEYLHEHIHDTEAAKVGGSESAAPARRSALQTGCPFLARGGGAARGPCPSRARPRRRTSPRRSGPPTATTVSAAEPARGLADVARAPVPLREPPRQGRALRLRDAGHVPVARRRGRAEIRGHRRRHAAGLRLADAERLRSLLAFVAAAYARCDGAAASPRPGTLGDRRLPADVYAALGHVSERLGRPRKKMCYADCVLYNWTDESAAGHWAEGTRGGAPSLVARFLAVSEEDAFWKLLLSVERTSPKIVAAILRGREAMRLRAADGLGAALGDLRAALRAASEAHVFRPGPAGRGERVVMRRLRHFLFPAGGTDADLAAFLYTGDSALLPACWKFLGAPRAPPGSDLQATRDAARRTMPGPHRDFLDALDAKTSARSFVLGLTSEDRRAPVHTLAVVEAEYNGCLDELGRYCSRRSQLVCRYLPNYAADFRKHEFDHDRRALISGRLNVVLRHRLAQGSGDELDEEAAALDAAVEKAAAVQKGRSRADSCASDER
ncbi:indoleamine 2,3-dioxygenase [Aureococcus anophagefferens]|nr:indoleamine 2,3-dioxygenase [Aureococcus anophagefferens]